MAMKLCSKCWGSGRTNHGAICTICNGTGEHNRLTLLVWITIAILGSGAALWLGQIVWKAMQ